MIKSAGNLMLVLKRLPEGSVHDKLALNEILRDHGVSG